MYAVEADLEELFISLVGRQRREGLQDGLQGVPVVGAVYVDGHAGGGDPVEFAFGWGAVAGLHAHGDADVELPAEVAQDGPAQARRCNGA